MKFALLLSFLLSVSMPVWAEQEYLQQFPMRKQTKFFDFHYIRNADKVAEIARFADGFVDLVRREFFKANFAYPIKVLVLEDRDIVGMPG